jgi:hypothetical protein
MGKVLQVACYFILVFYSYYWFCCLIWFHSLCSVF